MSTEHHFNRYQQGAYERIKHWVDNGATQVFRLKGAYGSGKLLIAKSLIEYLIRNNHKVILLAPDAETALSLNESGISNVTSIYSWLYDEKPYLDKNRLIYPIARESVNYETDIIIILEAHLLSDSKFYSEEMRFGSGKIITDFIDSFRDGNFEYRINRKKTESNPQFPKLIVIGDPYQQSRGVQAMSLINSELFKENLIHVTNYEIKNLITTETEKEVFDFQSLLINQICDKKFTKLPSVDPNNYRITAGKVDCKIVAREVSEYPQKAVYLTSTNSDVQEFNRYVRNIRFSGSESEALVAGDIVELRNKTIDLDKANDDSSDDDWIDSGEVVQVVETYGVVHREPNLTFENRKNEFFSIAAARIRYSKGEGSIYYIPEFLTYEKPELSESQAIALHNLAKVESREKVNQLNDEIIEAKQLDIEEIRSTAYRRSKFNNAARLRYAYAITVHRAQSFGRRLPKVYLDGSSAHDTLNPASESYFRRLYSVTTLDTEKLIIHPYPELTPLSKAKWELNECQISPIRKDNRFHFDQSRVLSGDEKETLTKNGFSTLEPMLGIAYITMLETIERSKWEILDVKHHKYLERYFFSCADGQVRVDFNYNKNFLFKIGNTKVETGENSIASELKFLFHTKHNFCSQSVESAVELFEQHINKTNWNLTSVQEHQYSAILTVEAKVGSARLLLDIPETLINRKGVISRVKLLQVDDRDVLSQFSKDFCNG